MNKTEILDIVNEPSKHIQTVKIDGKDSIVYSSKFVELLELVSTMLTKADMVDILEDIKLEIKGYCDDQYAENEYPAGYAVIDIIQQKINKLKGE